MNKIKIDVTDSEGNTFNGIFKDQASADAWISDHQANWGDGVTPVQTDISAESEAQSSVATGLKAQEFGNEVIAAVYGINDASAITTDQLLAIMNDATLQLAERLLRAGSLVSAKQVIATISEQLFTKEQVAQISGLIDQKIIELDQYRESL